MSVPNLPVLDRNRFKANDILGVVHRDLGAASLARIVSDLNRALSPQAKIPF